MNIPINLLTFRNQINDIDKKIIKLLYRRKQLSQDIAKEKILYKIPIKDTSRENQLITNLIKLAKEYGLNQTYIINIFQTIINDSIEIQQKTVDFNKKSYNFKKIAYLGPKGSYSYFATCKYANLYSKKLIKYEFSDFKNVINAAEKKITDYAILPIENTCSGSINQVFDLLQSTNLSIINEVHLPIKHCLLIKNVTNLYNIQYIYSHIQPLEQCSIFINQFPHWKIKITHSTADAMKKISNITTNNVAAIGSIEGGFLYNLKPLKKHIANKKNNITRFIILSKKNVKICNDFVENKITFLIQTKKNYNHIIKILYIFYKKNLFLSHVKFRPSLSSIKPWEKVFFIDVIYNTNTISIQKVLNIMNSLDNSIQLLGLYPISNKI